MLNVVPPTASESPSNQGSEAQLRDRALEAARRASESIAPTWPLDRFIAVNPFWPQIHRPFSEVAIDLGAASGARLLLSPRAYEEALRSGAIARRHLLWALAEVDGAPSESALLASLSRDGGTTPRARVMDVAGAGLPRPAEGTWRTWVVNRTSQFCAAYFDDGQAQLGPPRDGGLYRSWRRQARVDRAPGWWLGQGRYEAALSQLDDDAEDWIPRALGALEVPEADWEVYARDLLLDVNGWASWCAYRRWTAALSGGQDDHLLQLLAIRLAWEWILLSAGGEEVRAQWRRARAQWPRAKERAAADQRVGWIVQRASELAWQEGAIEALAGPRGPRPVAAARAQVVFCIDVRSEVFRRALEGVDPQVQTLGFAGFFGLPIEFRPLGAELTRPQLPGLLGAKLRVKEVGPQGVEEGRARALERHRGWQGFRTHPFSSFPFVDVAGLGYAASALAETLGLSRSKPPAGGATLRLETLEGAEVPLLARVRLAESILRGMSLTQDFAPLVVLVAHGSECRNNAHRAGLDCGACGGQAGEVNARAAAALLNDAEVRTALLERGLGIPTTTRFVAGLHNTTTDELRLFEAEGVAPEDLTQLRSAFAAAGARARRERIARLPGASTDPGMAEVEVQARAQGWAEVRPEWGLAGNAGFVVAPRERTRGLNLEGRVFLHEYRADQDPGFLVLEQIMTAPMVVAHWINLQYYASTVAPAHYGSGNKLLHNVVGGHLGVFEGNGGDLRIGLPWQSVHDGVRTAHPPLRLSVFIEAPREAIDGVLHQHATVRNLVENEWLFLFRIDPNTGAVEARQRGTWRSFPKAPPPGPDEGPARDSLPTSPHAAVEP